MRKEETKLKGEEAEKEFMNWLNKHNILFCCFRQDPETYSTAFKLNGIKRPDFIIFPENKIPIFVDAQFNKPARKYRAFHINFNEVQSYSKLEDITGIKVWLVFGNRDYHYSVWHWIPIKKVVQHKHYSNAKGKGSYYSVPLEEFRIINDKDDLNKLIQLQDRSKTYTFQEIRKTYPRAYEKWSKDEDNTLKTEYSKGKSVKELATIFQRKPSVVRSRLIKLGLIK